MLFCITFHEAASLSVSVGCFALPRVPLGRNSFLGLFVLDNQCRQLYNDSRLPPGNGVEQRGQSQACLYSAEQASHHATRLHNGVAQREQSQARLCVDFVSQFRIQNSHPHLAYRPEAAIVYTHLVCANLLEVPSEGSALDTLHGRR